MNQLVSTLKGFAVLLLSTVAVAACTSRDKTSTESEAAAPQELAEKTVTTASNEMDAAEREQHIAECKTFIAAFYEGLEESGFDKDYVKKYVTTNVAQWLKDMYDYDCDGDDCMAAWLFSYNMTDPGELQERRIDALDDNTYRVANVYTGSADGDYMYTIRLGLVKEGDTFKIDKIEIVD